MRCGPERDTHWSVQPSCMSVFTALLAAVVGAVAGGLVSYPFAGSIATVTVSQRHSEARVRGVARLRQALADLATAELDGNLPNWSTTVKV